MPKIHELVDIACHTNNLQDLAVLYIDKKTVLSTDSENHTPLMIAAQIGNIKVIKFLDDKADELLGYDVYKIFNMRDNSGCNALSLAAKNGHIQAVVTLYELGAYDTFTANQDDWVIYAAMDIDKSQDEDGIAKSLKEDAQRRLTEIYKKDLYDTVTNAQSTSIQIRKAVQRVDSINTIVYDDHTALYHAVRFGNITAVKILLEDGAMIFPEILPLALDSKNEEIISLIGQSMPLSAKGISWGYLLDILLDHAIRKNNAKVATRLLPNMTITKLQEALLYSAELGSDDVIKCLLVHGVDVNSIENNHRTRTAAMLAAKKGRLSALKILIDKGANLHLRSEHGIGLTALDYAKIYRRKSCVQLILETFALEKYGDTAVNRAAAHGAINDLFACSKDEKSLKTALSVAKETKQPASFIREIRQFLVNKYPDSKILPFAKFFSKKAKKQ